MSRTTRPLTADERAMVERNLALVPAALRGLPLVLQQTAAWTPADAHAVGYEALCRAAQTYNPERGVAFSTWAYHRIRGAVRDEQRRLRIVSRAHGVRPRPLSLDLPVPDGEGGTIVLGGTLRDPAPSVAQQVEDAEAPARAAALLGCIGDPRTRRVAVAIVFGGRRQQELARTLGVTPGRVSQLWQRARQQVRGALAARDAEAA